MQVKISEEACALSGIIEMNEESFPQVEPDCKENKSFQLSNSNNRSPLGSVICPGLDRPRPSLSASGQ